MSCGYSYEGIVEVDGLLDLIILRDCERAPTLVCPNESFVCVYVLIVHIPHRVSIRNPFAKDFQSKYRIWIIQLIQHSKLLTIGCSGRWKFNPNPCPNWWYGLSLNYIYFALYNDLITCTMMISHPHGNVSFKILRRETASIHNEHVSRRGSRSFTAVYILRNLGIYAVAQCQQQLYSWR